MLGDFMRSGGACTNVPYVQMQITARRVGASVGIVGRRRSASSLQEQPSAWSRGPEVAPNAPRKRFESYAHFHTQSNPAAGAPTAFRIGMATMRRGKGVERIAGARFTV